MINPRATNGVLGVEEFKNRMSQSVIPFGAWDPAAVLHSYLLAQNLGLAVGRICFGNIRCTAGEN